MLGWLFGSRRQAAIPQKTAVLEGAHGRSGCWWDHPQVLPLAADKGFSTEVVGERQFQANIDHIVGGKTEEGHHAQVPAQLVFEDNPTDPNAVGVMINACRVGWIAAADAAELRKEMLEINKDRLALTCKAKIVGGWRRGKDDEGHYGVKLSLARPLRVHPSRKF